MKPKWKRDLEDYFAGQLESDGGLRSWLGRWEGGPIRGGTSYASPPEPAISAFGSVRVARVVESALRELSEDERRILAALHAPRPPLGLDRSAWVAMLAEDLVLPILEEEGADRQRRAAERLRTALRSGSDEDARHALELAQALTTPTVSVLDRMRALKERNKPSDRRLLRRVGILVDRTSKAVLEAFADAWSAAVAAERDARRARFRATVEGR